MKSNTIISFSLGGLLILWPLFLGDVYSFTQASTGFASSATLKRRTSLFGIDGKSKWHPRVISCQKLLATSAIHETTSNVATTSPYYSDVTTPLNPSKASSAICDPSVVSLRKGSNVVHIVGTAHVSSASADLAGLLVREIKPKVVFVELDVMRIAKAFKGAIPPPGVKMAVLDRNGNLRVGVTQKPGFWKSLFLKLINALGTPILYWQLEMAGFPVGKEFVNSVKEGIENDALIVLGDQRMDVTQRHMKKALSKMDANKIRELDKKLNDVMKSHIPEMKQLEEKGSRITARDFSEFVERMKTKDIQDELMIVYKKEVPDLWASMIGERDMYMARGINSLSQFDTIVAVMGLSHLDGVTRNLKGMHWSIIPKPPPCLPTDHNEPNKPKGVVKSFLQNILQKS